MSVWRILHSLHFPLLFFAHWVRDGFGEGEGGGLEQIKSSWDSKIPFLLLLSFFLGGGGGGGHWNIHAPVQSKRVEFSSEVCVKSSMAHSATPKKNAWRMHWHCGTGFFILSKRSKDKNIFRKKPYFHTLLAEAEMLNDYLFNSLIKLLWSRTLKPPLNFTCQMWKKINDIFLFEFN